MSTAVFGICRLSIRYVSKVDSNVKVNGIIYKKYFYNVEVNENVQI